MVDIGAERHLVVEIVGSFQDDKILPNQNQTFGSLLERMFNAYIIETNGSQ